MVTHGEGPSRVTASDSAVSHVFCRQQGEEEVRRGRGRWEGGEEGGEGANGEWQASGG
jgi:hypothetical protein